MALPPWLLELSKVGAGSVLIAVVIAFAPYWALVGIAALTAIFARSRRRRKAALKVLKLLRWRPRRTGKRPPAGAGP